MKSRLWKWSCTTRWLMSQVLPRRSSSPRSSATTNFPGYFLRLISISKSMVPRSSRVAHLAARSALAGPGCIRRSWTGLRNDDRMALSEDPESASASISLPSTWTQRRGRFLCVVRAAVSVGLTWHRRLCRECFLPPPFSSFPGADFSFSLPAQDNLDDNAFLGSNDKVVVVEFLYYLGGYV